MKQKIIVALAKLLVVGVLAAAVSGCELAGRETRDVQEVPEDAPLSEFILGSWASEQAYDVEGKESTYQYEMQVDRNIIKWMWFTTEGRFLDGATSEYSFTDTNRIFIDNKRIRGGEKWLLERDGQTLIVHRTIENRTHLIIFARTANMR